MQTKSLEGQECENVNRVFIVELQSKDLKDPYTLYAKIITSALLLSYGIRRGTAVCIELSHGWLVAHGAKIRRLFADESSSTGLVRAVIRQGYHSGIGVKRSCIYADCCRSELSMENLRELHRREGLDLPICIRFRLDNHEVDVHGYRVAVWYVIAVTNIVLDILGINT